MAVLCRQNHLKRRFLDPWRNKLQSSKACWFQWFLCSSLALGNWLRGVCLYIEANLVHRTLSYKGVKTSFELMGFKIARLTAICNESKRTIFASGGFRLLQMVLELDTGQCVSENVRPLMEVDCEVSHRLERGTKHSL